jgi:UTP:GlnB (protein PII) uridylyltransferase
MATVAELRKGLAATTVPPDIAKALLKGASSLWLSSDSAAQLAGDLALCHPPLKRNEVRARAVGDDDEWRLTVVAHDRKGLLADTAAILSGDDFCIQGASATTWEALDLALHSITMTGPVPSEEKLDEIGATLRAASRGTRPSLPFTPIGRAFVRHTGSANGDAMISVVAPDQKGLLATVCRFFSDAGVSIQAAWITGEGEANDVFVVDGRVDVAALEQQLTLDDHSIQAVVGSMVTDARKAGEAVVRGGAELLGRLLKRD